MLFAVTESSAESVITSRTAESLFGHLASRFVPQRENLATEALRWILARSPAAEAAMRTSLGAFGPSVAGPLIWSTQEAGAGGIPDLIGREGDRVRVYVEAKFEAGLTPNQPTGYLDRLAEGDLLVFLVPSVRLQILWPVVCRRAQADPGPDTSGGSRSVQLSSGNTMAMITWREVMDGLLLAASTANDLDAYGNLQQLNGLVTQAEAETFRPITSDELTGTTGRRIADFCAIVDTVVEALQQREADGTTLGDKHGLRAAGGPTWWGHYIRLNGWECYLHFSGDRWAWQASTPFWLFVKDRSGKMSETVRQALATLLSSSSIPRAFDEPSGMAVALIPPTEADREKVVNALLGQVRDVVSMMRRYEEAHPPTPDSDSPETPTEVIDSGAGISQSSG
jgi:hypothetical protein